MFVQQKNLTRKNMLYNLKTESLYDHINYFREIIFEKMQKPSREDESHEEFVQRQLKINSGKDWNLICSGIDLIGDTCLSIDHFIRFGLEGSCRHDEIGEKYLRLYGVLNSTYIQQEAVYLLLKLFQAQSQSEFRERIERLEVRNSRHKLGAHSVDYIDKHQNELLSFVPICSEMTGFHCSYFCNNNNEIGTINLKTSLDEHLELMIEIMRATIIKASNTIYKPNPEKVKEIELTLEELQIKKEGGQIYNGKNGTKVIMSKMIKM